jgi:hypothetical protein
MRRLSRRCGWIIYSIRPILSQVAEDAFAGAHEAACHGYD